MKTIVITGSTRGIGFGLADSFLALGCNVCVSGRAVESVDRAVNDLTARHGKERVFGAACDVTHYDRIQALWDTVQAHFGNIDIWINNAGLAHALMNYWELPPDLIKTVVDTNILGSMYGSQVALKGMIAQGSGAIYNLEGLGSGGGRKVKGLPIYGTTKAALRYLDEALVLETEGTPVIVGAIAPGMVVTDMITGQYAGKPEEFEKVKRIFNIISDRVETVTPWIAKKVLENQKTGALIAWSNPIRLFGRFMSAPFHKRDVFSPKQ
jgi:NAD(P)-dependent dehydrogenase (short-subunit alcohol dehydrogenase family)